MLKFLKRLFAPRRQLEIESTIQEFTDGYMGPLETFDRLVYLGMSEQEAHKLIFHDLKDLRGYSTIG